ncbi:hypothetical protein A0J61_09153 [Choanephora cucurbitarum]|uniref:Uncharacterized protein n=1 Tax=Choanephora cucurbitarum TaxID=101091 RepID=A0A1C7N131_9FUNG|nr:hypothetical protein A0J61_09153 [Choanephora cucurbitarum]
MLTLIQSATKYIQNSEDENPTFEGYLRKHHVFVKNTINNNSSLTFEDAWNEYCKACRKCKVTLVKGKAKVAWKELIAGKIKNTTGTITTGLKRSFDTMNIRSNLNSFVPTAHEAEDFIFKDYNVSKALKDFSAASLAIFQSDNGAKLNFTADLPRWLALHSVIRLSKHLDATMTESFDSSRLEALRLHIRSNEFSKPARLSSALKIEVMDYLAEFEDNKNSKELKRKLQALALKNDGAVARVLETLVSLLSKMTNKSGPVGEKTVESLLDAVCGSIFKITDDHDPHKFDNVLFAGPHPLQRRRPDYVVEVGSIDPIINLVGEVKPFPSSSSGLSLGTYRLGVFSVALIEKHRLKSILAFQAKGLEVTFYLCLYKQGIYFMSEVERITLPSTYSDFCSFGVFLDTLYNISVLYEGHCVQQQQQQQQQQQTNLFDYATLKEMYHLSSSKSANTLSSAGMLASSSLSSRQQ